MYFISKHSSAEDETIFGSLIGIFGSYLYSANSYEEGIEIYRKKVIDVDGWDLVWSYEMISSSQCFCRHESIAVAFGIIGNEIYIASYGIKPNNTIAKFHLSSLNLLTHEIIDFETSENMPSEIAYNLCNQCSMPYIIANPHDPTQIFILPWSPESTPRNFPSDLLFTDCIQTKLRLNLDTKACQFLESTCFRIPAFNLHSNIGVLEFGKIIYFNNGEIILQEMGDLETKMEIVQESEMKNCIFAGFHSDLNQLKCVAFENNGDINGYKCNLFNVEITEAKIKFTKFASLPSTPSPSDPRFCNFLLNSQMLISPYQTQIFTYILGVLSLSEASLIAASNSTNPCYKAYEKISNKKYERGDYSAVFRESGNFGFSQTDIKCFLGIPNSYEIVRHSMLEK